MENKVIASIRLDVNLLTCTLIDAMKLSGENHDILLCSQKEKKMEMKEKKMEYVEQKVTYKDAIYEDEDVKKDIANCKIKVTLTTYNLSSQL